MSRLFKPIADAIAAFAREQHKPLTERWTTWDALAKHVNESVSVRHRFKKPELLRDFVLQHRGDMFVSHDTMIRELPNQAVVVWWEEIEPDLSQVDPEILRAIAKGIRAGLKL